MSLGSQMDPSEICKDGTLLGDFLRETRKYDDTIILRLNNADTLGRGRPQDKKDECTKVMNDLLRLWRMRADLLHTCAAQPPTASTESGSRAESADETQKRFIATQRQVERIVMQRSLGVFRRRCLSTSTSHAMDLINAL